MEIRFAHLVLLSQDSYPVDFDEGLGIAKSRFKGFTLSSPFSDNIKLDFEEDCCYVNVLEDNLLKLHVTLGSLVLGQELSKITLEDILITEGWNVVDLDYVFDTSDFGRVELSPVSLEFEDYNGNTFNIPLTE
jgi:hypothetical protein